MKAKAKHRFARVAPRKVRLVADLVRGLEVSKALDILALNKRSAAPMLSKVISSAVANARDRGSADVDKLVVSEAFVDQGPMLKRFLPRAMGRATKIQKKTSHITVVVSDE